MALAAKANTGSGHSPAMHVTTNTKIAKIMSRKSKALRIIMG
jgi:hypothetical protein